MAVNGARNAGLLAVRILAVGDPDLTVRMEAFQEEIASDGPGPGRRRCPEESTDTWLRRHLAQRLGYAADAKLLIVNADDLGSCHSANVGVYECLRHGDGHQRHADGARARGPGRRAAATGARTSGSTSRSTPSTSCTAGAPSPTPRRCSAATAGSRGPSRTSGTTPTSTRSAASAGPRSSGPSCGAST